MRAASPTNRHTGSSQVASCAVSSIQRCNASVVSNVVSRTVVVSVPTLATIVAGPVRAVRHHEAVRVGGLGLAMSMVVVLLQEQPARRRETAPPRRGAPIRTAERAIRR